MKPKKEKLLKQQLYDDSMNFKIIKVLPLIIVLIFSVIQVTSLVILAEQDDTWNAEIVITTADGENVDSIILAESSDANDGPPNDAFDIFKSPAPPEPFLYCTLNDGLSNPYHILSKDCRYYPDTYKCFNLTVQWNPAEASLTKTINLSWNPNDFDASEYTYVNLTDDDGMGNPGIFLTDMKVNDIYQFTLTSSGGMPPYTVSKHFHIVCDYKESTGDDDDDDLPINGPGDDDDDHDPPIPPSNQPPDADASRSDFQGIADEAVYFDGSLSVDDSMISNFSWDFGDGTMGFGEITTHVFNDSGSFIVTLTVTDEDGLTDEDSISINVLKNKNNPPTAPVIQGNTTGHQNIVYSYTFQSTDVDNDTIKYLIDWGDGTTTITDFYKNGIIIKKNHTWINSGVYIINASSLDNRSGTSPSTKYSVLIDADYVKDIGFLFDNNRDGIFDVFQNKDTNKKTEMEIVNGNYLIDSDDDGEWEYQYDYVNGLLSSYGEKEENDETNGSEGSPIILIVMIIFFLIIGAVALIYINKSS